MSRKGGFVVELLLIGIVLGVIFWLLSRRKPTPSQPEENLDGAIERVLDSTGVKTDWGQPKRPQTWPSLTGDPKAKSW